MNPNHALAFTWSADAFMNFLIAAAIVKAAARNCGNPVRLVDRYFGRGFPRWLRRRQVTFPALWWPVAGRWILAAFFAVTVVKLANIAWVSWQRNIFGNGPATPATWTMVIIRLAPMAVEIWLFRRAWTRGLIDDEPRR